MIRISGRKSATAAAALLATLFVGPATTPAQAADEMRFVDRWSYDVPEDLFPVREMPPGSILLNPEKRTGFQLFDLVGNRTFLRIFNLDTLKVRNEVILPRKIIPGRGQSIRQYIHAIDPDNNILYLPYYLSIQLPGTNSFGGLYGISGDTGEIVHSFERMQANDPTRAVSADDQIAGPDDVSLCTSNACLPQTFGIAPTLVAMDFTSSFISGGRSKLVMFWVEPNGPGIDAQFQVTWVTQWDAQTGVQDFSYRMQSCQTRVPANTASTYPLSIFQARLGAGIYVGCNAPGNTGQVARIRLDGNGQPAGEDTFPGPNAVTDVLADKETDRLLFRVSTSSSGESFWVFNGSSSNYSGVVATSLADVPTFGGVDQASGRLYNMVPATSRGNLRQPAALVTSDVRRTPAPQVTLHQQVFVESDMALAIDNKHPSGKTRIFAHPLDATHFEIIEDPIPVGFDEPASDQDRFTVDVVEEEGVTDANFTGTGHAYGFRTLLAGGAQGFVPVGVDVSGANPRSTVDRINSPCNKPDRELRLGSVPFANLANALTSAEAAAGSTEAGTIADLREPTGRCHPRPVGTEGIDDLNQVPAPLGSDDDADGQSNLDEVVGSEWPFFAAQCSGQGNDEQVTTLRPLNREPFPAEGPADPEIPEQAPPEVPRTPPQTGTPVDEARRSPRNTPIALEHNRASVVCGQTEELVHGDALASGLVMGGLTPGVETLEIGSVGGFTRLYREKGRGLVTETVAYVRNLRLGDILSIDVAYSKAVAWAGGRPGTAGTSLDRRICGLAIPSQFEGQYSVIPIDTPAGDLPPDPEPIPVGDPLYEATKGIEDPTTGDQGVSYPIGNVDPLNHSSEDQTVPAAVAACSETPVAQAGATPLGERPVLELINRALGARGRAYIPEPDPELRQGSPGGYLASLQKDRLQQIGSRAVSNDGTTQVPALEIQLFNDDPTTGRGRQLFQFAGVDASVTYGIYLLNPDGTTPIDDPNDDLPPSDITDDLPYFDDGTQIPPIGGTPTPPTTQPPATGVFAPVTYLYRGVTFLARSWQDAALAAGVLMLLVGPLMLMARRRALRTLA